MPIKIGSKVQDNEGRDCKVVDISFSGTGQELEAMGVCSEKLIKVEYPDQSQRVYPMDELSETLEDYLPAIVLKKIFNRLKRSQMGAFNYLKTDGSHDCRYYDGQMSICEPLIKMIRDELPELARQCDVCERSGKICDTFKCVGDETLCIMGCTVPIDSLRILWNKCLDLETDVGMYRDPHDLPEEKFDIVDI